MDKYSDVRVPIAENNPSIKRNNRKCVLCGKCKDVCKKKMGVSGYWKYDSEDIVCINCGQCANVCPTEAITEQDDTQKLLDSINDDEKKVVIITSPAVRVSMGENFGFKSGDVVDKKIVGALKKLGADYVFDVTFGADLTVMEEAYELVDRIKNNKTLPQFTSCCPAWVKFVETFYPQYIRNLSSCKSPIAMQSSIIKHYFADKMNIDVKNLVVVAVTPCVAKKFEIEREELASSYGKDTDIVVSVREISRLLKKKKIDLLKVKEQDYDTAFPTGSGAGVIFGASGGVAEAAIRTAYYIITGKNPDKDLLCFKKLRGLKDVKVAKVMLGERELSVCVIFGTMSARTVLDKLKTKKYDFIEVMACPNGCVGGGGQPKTNNVDQTVEARGNGLYTYDHNKEIRCSHDNPVIKDLYSQFLKSPLSEKSKELLHTSYQDRSKK